MNELRVVVVDDELLGRRRLARLAGETPGVKVIAECDSGEAALARVSEGGIDALLLDIQLGAVSGLDVLRQLGGGLPLVVFVTAHAEHAVHAFDGGAVDYVLKPIEPARLARALERARELVLAYAARPVVGGVTPPAGATASLNEPWPVVGGVNPPAGASASLNEPWPVIGGVNPPAGATASLNEPWPVVGGVNPPAGASASLNEPWPVIGGVNPPAGATASLNASGPPTPSEPPETATELELRGPLRLAIPTRRGLKVIDPGSIRYAIVDGESVLIHTEEGVFVTDFRLVALEKKLPADRFVRAHRRVLLNLEHVVGLEAAGTSVHLAELSDGATVPISRQAARALRRRWSLP
jgi:DNA-binding LytR/AlgR family response regulator